MNKIPAVLPKDVALLFDYENNDFSKSPIIDRHLPFADEPLMRSLMFNDVTVFDFEMNLAEKAKLLDRSLFLLREDVDVDRTFFNIWRTPSITNRLRVNLKNVFNGTNVDSNAALGITAELLLAASTSKLYTSCNDKLTCEYYHFDNNVFLQFSYANGELASVHFWRNNRFYDVDISFVKLKPAFAALGKVYKPTIPTFDGPLRNYYSDKRAEANQ